MMRRRYDLRVSSRLGYGSLLGALALTATSCANGGMVPSTLSSATSPRPIITASRLQGNHSRRRVKVFITIVVHRHYRKHRADTPDTGKTPGYVSASTQSVTISVNGGAAVPTNIGSKTPGCVQYSLDELECTIPAGAPTGADSFDVRLWDQPNGGGKLLGVGDETALITVVPGYFTITVEGVVASMKLSLPPFTGGQSCGATPQTIPLTVLAYDADKNLITGAAKYYNPISLSITNGNQFGSLALSTAEVASPGTAVNVNYNNGPTGSPITISASAQGATAASVSVDPQNYWPLNVTYTYTSLSPPNPTTLIETVTPTTSLPPNYFNGGLAGFSGVPTNVCDIHGRV